MNFMATKKKQPELPPALIGELILLRYKTERCRIDLLNAMSGLDGLADRTKELLEKYGKKAE